MNQSLVTGIAVVLAAVSCAQAAPRVIISEIMYNPASEERRGEAEWVEIVNVGDEPIEIKGWRLDDEDKDDWGVFSCTLAAGGVAVLVNSAFVNEAEFRLAWDSTASLGSTPSYQVIPVKWGGLANLATADNEILQLLDEKGAKVCQVNYETSGDWPGLSVGGGPSIYLTDLKATNLDVGKLWKASKDGEAGARHSQVTKVFNQADTGSPGYVEQSASKPRPMVPGSSPSEPLDGKPGEKPGDRKKESGGGRP